MAYLRLKNDGTEEYCPNAIEIKVKGYIGCTFHLRCTQQEEIPLEDQVIFKEVKEKEPIKEEVNNAISELEL